MGNAFASAPYLVQWYEYTGVLGGSLWVLLVSILVHFIAKSKLKHNRRIYLIYAGGTVLFPVIVSFIIQANYTVKGKKTEVVIVQPNIDPYNQKFATGTQFIPYQEQMQNFIAQSKNQLTPNTHLLLFPETAFDQQYNELSLEQKCGV